MQMIKPLLIALLLCCTTAAIAQPVTEANASNKAMKYLDEGVQRAMAKYYDKALISFQNAINEEPEFVTAWQYLGDTYRNMKNDSMAVEAYLKTLELDPDRDAILYSQNRKVILACTKKLMNIWSYFFKTPMLREI